MPACLTDTEKESDYCRRQRDPALVRAGERAPNLLQNAKSLSVGQLWKGEGGDDRHPERQNPSASNSARRTWILLQWILQIPSYREQWWEVSLIRGTKWIRHPGARKVWSSSVYVEGKSYGHLDDHLCTSLILLGLVLLLWCFSLFLIIFFVFIS